MGEFRYVLPPPPDRRRPSLTALARPAPVGVPASPEPELAAGHGGGDGGRLLRVRRCAAEEATSRRDAWIGAGGARQLAAPPGVDAWERRRPDVATPGGWRRQRLAVAVRAAEALLIHWSVPEPPSEAEEERWTALLLRLAARPEERGWRA